MPAAEMGLYRGCSEDTFVSREEIMQQAAQSAVKENNVVFLTPLFANNKQFDDYAKIFQERQQERELKERIPEHVEIKIDTDKPIALIPFGDIHLGGEAVDYRLFSKHVVETACAAGAFVFTIGDITDSYWWGKQAQDSELGTFREQNEFMRATLKMFSQQKKLLAAWLGDHDGWSGAMGETAYSEFTETYGAYYLEGTSYVTLHVGEQTYKLSAAHRHNGFSIYNKAHPAIRVYQDEAEGADICITAHTHRKAYLAQPVKRFGGKNELVHFLSLGTYKQTDEYARKKGFGRLSDDELGPEVIIFSPYQKQIQVAWTVSEGLKLLQMMRV